MGHKKDFDRMREERQLDKVRWETSKTLGLNSDSKMRRLLQTFEVEKEGLTPMKALVKEAEQAISEEGGRIAEANLEDRREDGNRKKRGR